MLSSKLSLKSFLLQGSFLQRSSFIQCLISYLTYKGSQWQSVILIIGSKSSLQRIYLTFFPWPHSNTLCKSLTDMLSRNKLAQERVQYFRSLNIHLLKLRNGSLLREMWLIFMKLWISCIILIISLSITIDETTLQKCRRHFRKST